MSITYNPTTNFGAKDTLPANDPDKVIVGAEFTSEFAAIQAAFALAAPTSNPTFSGTATYNNLTVAGSFTSRGIDDNATTTQLTLNDSDSVFNNDTKVVRSHRYGTAFSIENTSTGGKAWELRSTGVDNLLGTGDLQFNVDSNSSLTLKADRSAEFNGDLTTYGAFTSKGIDDNATSTALTVTNSGIAATLTTAAQPNITSVGTLTGFTSTGIDDNATSTAITIDANENVGIGTTSPVTTFEVEGAGTEPMRISSSLGNSGSVAGTGSLGLDFFSGSTHPAVLLSSHENSIATYLSNFSISLRASNADTAPTERFRISHSGNVGIGTDSPNQRLTLANDTAGSTVGLNFQTSRTPRGSILYNSSLGLMDFTSGYSGYGGQFVFTNNSSESMRIDSDGNVGIGTSDPVAKIDAKASGDDERLVRISHPSSPTVAAGYFGFTDTGSGANTGVALGVQYAGDYVDAITIDRETRNVLVTDGRLLVGGNNGVASDRLAAGNNSSQGAQVGKVSLSRSGSGYPVVGYNCHATTTVNTYSREADDYASWVSFIAGGVQTRTTTVTGTGTANGIAGPYVARGGTDWTASSDRKFKENLEVIPYGLDAVSRLEPLVYDRNDREGVSEIGFVAQDVEPVIPHVVTKNDEDEYGIQYARMVPVLVKAMQEQQAMIEALKAEVEALKNA